MPLFIPKSLLEGAQGGAQTKRYRDFVIAYFEGEGALAVPNAVWQPVAAWANGRQPTGNRMRDRSMLLQRLDVLVTRRGTTVASTAGGMVQLARLRNSMKSEGVDLKEWNFPADSVLNNALDPGAGKKDQDEPGAAESGPAPEEQGPGSFTRLGPQTVRSSAGFEVRIVDQYTAQYREGTLTAVIRGVPGTVGGRPGFKIKAEALMLEALSEAQRARLLGNFRAAMEYLGVAVML